MDNETEYTSDIAFTSSVKAHQEAHGSRRAYARMEQKGGFKDTVTEELASYIAARDSFYLSTVNADGQPYVQHRGGQPGFLKVLDEKRLAFADFGGNKQFITLGNLDDNPKAFLFLMDYKNRRRVKVWGRAEVIDDDAGLLADLSDDDYGAAPERVIVFHVDAWDANCPQHITQRWSEAEVAPVIEAMQTRIDALEAELAALRTEN